jgi:hypothetical protein
VLEQGREMPRRRKDSQNRMCEDPMKRTMPEGMPGGVASWWTHLEVLTYLRVNYRSLRVAMEATPDHIRKPWTNFGNGQRPS